MPRVNDLYLILDCVHWFVIFDSSSLDVTNGGCARIKSSSMQPEIQEILCYDMNCSDKCFNTILTDFWKLTVMTFIITVDVLLTLLNVCRLVG
jgi:hypothetical protein